MKLKPKRIENWAPEKRWYYGDGNDGDGNDGAYQALEGISIGDELGALTFLFGLTWRDRLRLLFGRGVYVSVLSFGRPIMPLRVDSSEPEFVETWRAKL